MQLKTMKKLTLTLALIPFLIGCSDLVQESNNDENDYQEGYEAGYAEGHDDVQSPSGSASTSPNSTCLPCISEVSPLFEEVDSWNACIDKCKNLVYNGKDDWRMPTVDEVSVYLTTLDVPGLDVPGGQPYGWASTVFTRTPIEINEYGREFVNHPSWHHPISSMAVFHEVFGTVEFKNNEINASCRCVR